MSQWIYPHAREGPYRWVLVRHKDVSIPGRFWFYGVSRSDVLRHDRHEVLEEGRDDSDGKDRLAEEARKIIMVKKVMEE